MSKIFYWLYWQKIKKNVFSISGHLVPGQEKKLFYLASELKGNATILEIGAFKGRSTSAIAYGCKKTKGTLWSIDTFNGNPENTDELTDKSYLAEFWHNINRCNLQQIVRPLVGRSDYYYHEWSRPIDMLWIDGSHQYDIVKNDVMTFWQWLNKGGIIVMHDVYQISHEKYFGDWGPTKIWEEFVFPRVDNINYFHNLVWAYKK